MIEVFAIFDKKARCYMAPFFQPNELVAMRNVGSAVVDEESLLGRYPEDYDLYRVGYWHEDSGLIEPPDNGLTFLINCASMKRIQQEARENAS